MSDDNVRHMPLSPEALLNAAVAGFQAFRPPQPPDPELTLWDDVVRMRLGSMAYMAPGQPAKMTSVEEAIDAADKVVTARRKFAASRQP